jgi:hypothetical protein
LLTATNPNLLPLCDTDILALWRAADRIFPERCAGSPPGELLTLEKRLVPQIPFRGDEKGGSEKLALNLSPLSSVTMKESANQEHVASVTAMRVSSIGGSCIDRTAVSRVTQGVARCRVNRNGYMRFGSVTSRASRFEVRNVSVSCSAFSCSSRGHMLVWDPARRTSLC